MLCITARYEDQTIRWPLPAGEARLGAAHDNDLVLPFPGVSRRHAVITREDGQLRVTDLDSKNGMFLDGRLTREALLKPGDRIQIGRALLTFEEENSSDVELAMALRPAGSPVRREKDTSSGSVQDADAAAALRVIRMAEASPKFSGRRRSLFMEECRRALQAEAFTFCHRRNDGEVEIAANAGALPGPELLEEAVGSLPGKSRKPWTAVRHCGHRFVATAGRGANFVVALMPLRPPSWVGDFLAFVSDKLTHASHAGAAVEAAHPAAREAEPKAPPGMVVGTSEAMRRLMHQMQSTLWSGMDVLILGETGTGKELLARFVHSSGPSAEGRFLAINCAAIPSELLEAELFGVQGRVATGVDPRPGMFLQADGGSIFLDEIGEMAERLQAKMLRVLQEREVLPLGAGHPRKINVRVISASNRDLGALVTEGKFRADLFYRLRGLQFHLPPLRERKEDIAPLVFEFLTRASEEYGKTVTGVTRSALKLLEAHDWPGNVRELESEVKRAALVCPNGASLQAEHFATVKWQVERRGREERVVSQSEEAIRPDPHPTTASLRERVDEIERAAILEALRTSDGNQSRAARALGITRNGLALKLRRLGIGGKR